MRKTSASSVMEEALVVIGYWTISLGSDGMDD